MIGSLLLSACCTPDVVYQTNPLSRPERPKLPHVTEEEAKQVPDTILKKLMDRYFGVRDYAEKLEIIIDSTQLN